jgi:hypothetical protein
MAAKRSYEFVIEGPNSAKRVRQDVSSARQPARRRGRGNYSEVSSRANTLKNGLGACWRCRYLKKTASSILVRVDTSRADSLSVTKEISAGNAIEIRDFGGSIQT